MTHLHEIDLCPRAQPASRRAGISCIGIAILMLACAALSSPVAAQARNCDVREAQASLDARGYDPGPIDGLPGRKTRSAISRFQRDEGLPVSGTLSRATCDRLAGRAELPSPTPSPAAPAAAKPAAPKPAAPSPSAAPSTAPSAAPAAQSAKRAGGVDTTPLPWARLRGCGFLGKRRIENRIRVTRHATLPLDDGGAMTLAQGRSRGGPYDVMGVGTYVRIDAETEICGLRFETGAFTVTDNGFELADGTSFSTR